MTTRIFQVEMEHLRYGTNWSRNTILARTAAEAIRKAERLEGTKQIRAVGVTLLAETD